MPLRWKIFRLICIVQLMAAAAMLLQHIFRFTVGITFGNVAALLLFSFILLLCGLGINLVNNNYPDEIVQGKQKKTFNRLFLANFILLTFLFGLIISAFRYLLESADSLGTEALNLPLHFFVRPIIYSVVLLFQFTILFGLYKLRLELARNFSKKTFDFETS